MALLSMLFFINVLLCIWMFTEKEERISICITYLGSLAFAAPLIAADPIGPRCFYISYVFEVLTAAKNSSIFFEKQRRNTGFLSGTDPCSNSLYFSRILCENFYDNREVQ